MKAVEIARAGDVPAERGLAVAIGEHPLALFRVEQRIVALDGSCMRCTTLLVAGGFDGQEVTCAGCGWRYAVTTGHVSSLPQLRIETYEVTLVGDRVAVWVPFA
jgi:nitrite reductase (NADH) small subunit